MVCLSFWMFVLWCLDVCAVVSASSVVHLDLDTLKLIPGQLTLSFVITGGVPVIEYFNGFARKRI